MNDKTPASSNLLRAVLVSSVHSQVCMLEKLHNDALLCHRDVSDDLDREIEARGYTCPHCRDTYIDDPDCETCNGNGWVYDPSDGGTMNCPICEADDCTFCDGGRLDYEDIKTKERAMQEGRDELDDENLADMRDCGDK